jgi:hypothetical protein
MHQLYLMSRALGVILSGKDSRVSLSGIKIRPLPINGHLRSASWWWAFSCPPRYSCFPFPQATRVMAEIYRSCTGSRCTSIKVIITTHGMSWGDARLSISVMAISGFPNHYMEGNEHGFTCHRLSGLPRSSGAVRQHRDRRDEPDPVPGGVSPASAAPL